MKKIFTLVFIALSFCSFAQENTWNFTEVVEVPGTTKDELYNRGREWFAKSFKSSNDVLQMQDKEAGKLIGKGVIMVQSNCSVCGMSGIHPKYEGPVSFTIDLAFKDNKYKYTISEFVHKASYSGGSLTNEKPDCGGMVMSKKAWDALREQVKGKVDLMITGMKEAEAKANAKNEDW